MQFGLDGPSTSGWIEPMLEAKTQWEGIGMGMRTAAARLEGDGTRFVAVTGTNHSIVMDNAEGNSGPRPAELLLVAQAGCTAMDVIAILRKQRQSVTNYEVRVSGEQRADPHPHVFQRIQIVHDIDGNVEIEAVRRAIELSATRYCTVTGNLASGVAEIHHEYLVRDNAGVEQRGEVVVTGPGESPDHLGSQVVSAMA
jgi:putative redox protein